MTEETLNFTHDKPTMLSLGKGQMRELNTGIYKDINNDDTNAIVNRGKKNSIEMNMVNRYYDLMIGLEQCAFFYQ